MARRCAGRAAGLPIRHGCRRPVSVFTSRRHDHAHVMTRSLDHVTQRTFSAPTAAGRLLGMDEDQIAYGIAIAAASDAAFSTIRATPLSQRKRLPSAPSALSAMNALLLARREVQGPLAILEGASAIDTLLPKRLDVDGRQERYDGVVTSIIESTTRRSAPRPPSSADRNRPEAPCRSQRRDVHRSRRLRRL